ncbi:MAG: type 4a pilus biogenesis protein PilO [Sedimentisphaerales bacterium]|nr:type 4a pilus biogenesis protein PilO [Sedimentisphaerales bacterium]
MISVDKKQFVMSIAVVVLTIAFVLFQFIPLSRKAKILKAANVNLIAANRAVLEKQKALPKIHREIERTEEEIGNFDMKIPVDRSYGSFLEKLTLAMEQQGLTEFMVQPGVEVEINDKFQIPVKVKCKGTLGQIFDFFKVLETFERVIQIEEISLTNSSEADGNVEMQSNMNIFYRTV